MLEMFTYVKETACDGEKKSSEGLSLIIICSKTRVVQLELCS